MIDMRALEMRLAADPDDRQHEAAMDYLAGRRAQPGRTGLWLEDMVRWAVVAVLVFAAGVEVGMLWALWEWVR